MYRRSVIAVALGALCLLPLLWGQSSSNPELPPAPIQAKVTTSCTECHEARIIVQQRLSKAAWTKEVDKMAKWGALIDPQDRDAFIDYLSMNFGTDKPAYVPDRLRSAGGKTRK